MCIRDKKPRFFYYFGRKYFWKKRIVIFFLITLIIFFLPVLISSQTLAPFSRVKVQIVLGLRFHLLTGAPLAAVLGISICNLYRGGIFPKKIPNNGSLFSSMFLVWVHIITLIIQPELRNIALEIVIRFCQIPLFAVINMFCWLLMWIILCDEEVPWIENMPIKCKL